MADERAEALRKLEERLGEATQRAEQLMREVAEDTPEQKPPPEQEPPPEPEQKPPPAGWQAPGAGRGSGSLGSELDTVLSTLRSMRDLIPPEVVHRLAEALKEVLLAIRALIEYYLERLVRGRTAPAEVQDIPIE